MKKPGPTNQSASYVVSADPAGPAGFHPLRRSTPFLFCSVSPLVLLLGELPCFLSAHRTQVTWWEWASEQFFLPHFGSASHPVQDLSPNHLLPPSARAQQPFGLLNLNLTLASLSALPGSHQAHEFQLSAPTDPTTCSRPPAHSPAPDGLMFPKLSPCLLQKQIPHCHL